MQPVKRFEYDHWVDVDISQIASGDIFVLHDVAYMATAQPSMSDAKLVCGADIYKGGGHTLNFGKGRDYLCMVMDYVSSPAHDFGDGTVLICDIGRGSTNVYSPRLPLEQLNEFCKTHLDRYETFYRHNRRRIQAGEQPHFDKFW
ncbi:hypothetical protein KW429_11280 [Vibrio fluvialis]|nr:hypothetical protein [Vibrio fluvialis]MBY7902439.1 hypothetical protein [Vibrio fluvialis]